MSARLMVSGVIVMLSPMGDFSHVKAVSQLVDIHTDIRAQQR